MLRAVTDLVGVGPEVARKLSAAGITTLEALVRTYPRDYRDWRTPVPIAEIIRKAMSASRAHDTASAADAESNQEIAVGRIVRTSEFRGRVAIVAAELDDGTGCIKATWFGRRGLRFAVGDRLFVHGRAAVRRTRGAAPSVELNVLTHKRLADGEDYRGAVVPVYRSSKDLPSKTLASIFSKNLDELSGLVTPVVPPEVLARRGYGSLREAWLDAHRPATPQAALAARERLIFEEFFRLALVAALRRAERARGGGALAFVPDAALLERFGATLGFTLTGAQRRVIGEIWADMSRDAPMNRLLQGDVGSGKTLVAAAAVVLAAAGGAQSALMAPTEILAAQHAHKLAPLLLPLGIRVEGLSGGMSGRDRARVLDRLAGGECDLVVGTHALIVDDVEFRNLGLAVIDEQHRFGVAQRAKLRAKSRAPHTLHMTATPIPRTLAQTKYADLDLSILDELPPGRTPIETFVLRESRKARAYEFVRKNVAAGRQAYVVAPAIDESESSLTSALAELAAVRKDIFADLRVQLLHGRLPGREKDAVMTAFARHEADVLLATTVVEVGVDVPNASVMVILDAHRYGLAQLHQLRGRVGRGVARSFCILVAPDEAGEVTRLEILAGTTDGFEIAEADLRLRKEGELFEGSAQAGGARLLGNVVSDFALYMKAKADADALVAADPALALPEHRPLRAFSGDDSEVRARLLDS